MNHSTPTGLSSLHLLIHGRVQGVYYRVNAEAQARALGLRGWVRNRTSGEVEALVSGPAEQVTAFIDWAHEGPPAAQVSHIEVSPAERPEQEGFHILATA